MDSNPDILWLSLESVRADHTSLYGYRRNTTPYLDELSERSDASVLNLGCSASMWTPASTASILTGTHMSTHQVGRDGKAQEKLPPSLDTLPELLAERGYRTALFSPNPYISSDTGLDRGFEHAELITMTMSNISSFDSVTVDTLRTAFRRFRERPTISPTRLKTDLADSNNCLVERRVKRWFDGRYRGRDPFFTYVHIPSPHHPYRPIPKFLDSYIDEVDIGLEEAKRLCRDVYSGSEGIKRRMANGLNLSDDELDGIKAIYDAEIRYADYTANEIVGAARSASERPLVIVVTGDHGELFGEEGLIGHNLVLHDGVIRVPALTVGIDGVQDDDDVLTQQIDITSTLASVCDVRTDQFEGRDIRDEDRPYAISQRGLAHFDAYTEHNTAFDTSRFFEQPFTCVRTAKWKYLENESRRVLYELPDERTDKKDTYPEIVEELSDIIAAENIDWSTDRRAETVEFDEQARSQLEDLGYLS